MSGVGAFWWRSLGFLPKMGQKRGFGGPPFGDTFPPKITFLRRFLAVEIEFFGGEKLVASLKLATKKLCKITDFAIFGFLHGIQKLGHFSGIRNLMIRKNCA